MKKNQYLCAVLTIRKKVMIKMFVMPTCPYCDYVEKQVEGNPRFEVIDISKHVHNLQMFIDLRDNNPAFDEAKKIGDIGIPCYVLEDGTVTLSSKDVGLEPLPDDFGATCSIDGKGC
jgi:glutaredoxin-related protein